jgi:peptide/nickel transport system substrate-binding protein
MRTRAMAVLLAIALSAASAALVTSTSAAAAKIDPKGILRVGTSLTAVQGGSQFDLDPAKSDLLQVGYLRPIYDTLLHVAVDGSLAPGLATAWKTVDDRTIDLTLRKGVKFQDGEAFTAEAVRDALTRKHDNPLSNDPPLWKSFESIDVTGPLAVRLHLNRPTAGAFLNVLAVTVQAMIPSPKAAAAGTLSEHPVGAGPFAFDEYRKEQLLSLRRYAGYWDAPAYRLGGIDFVNSSADLNASLSSLFGGSFDLLGISQAQADAVKRQSGFSVFKQPSEDTYYFLAICNTTPPFDKAKFRQALQFAINRDELNQIATGGTGVIAYMGWPKGSQYYVPSIAKRWRYDPKRARQLLKQAGVAKGTSFKFISPIGADLDRLAEVIKAQLAKVDLDVHVQLSMNIPVDLYENNGAPMTISLNVFPGVERLLRRFAPDSAGNWCHHNDATINTLLNKIAAGPKDAAEAKALWTRVQKLVADYGAPIFLFFSSLLAAHSDKVVGLKHIYASGQGFDFAGVGVTR